MPDQTASRIELARLTVSRDGKCVLSALDCVIDAPRVGVVGRNGSGKSTLARVIAGLSAPDEGQALVCGHALAKDRKAAVRTVGLLFQNPDHQIIFPTVIEEMAFGLRQQGLPRKAADQEAMATLDRFGKGHWRDTSTAILSQGQKHLLCLMAVVAMKPRVLILDEPFAGLDLPTKAQLTRALGHYDGMVLHISHDPRDLQGYDRVLWLDAGTIREIGPAEGVLQSYEAEMLRAGGLDDLSDLAG